MGIYLPNMEMPTSCWACPFSERRDPDTDRCFITGRSYDATFVRLEFRLDDCPLVPVPKHGRLIDADALTIELMDRGVDQIQLDDLSEIQQAIADAPTIIETEGEDN